MGDQRQPVETRVHLVQAFVRNGMKTAKLEKEVADPSGLYFDLVERGFELLSVSIHERCTYVHLEDEEDKDPVPHMEEFAANPPKAVSRSVIEKRRELYRKFRDEKPGRMQSLRARFQVSQEVRAIRPEAGLSAPSELVSVLEDRPIEVLALPAPKRISILKRLRSLW